MLTESQLRQILPLLPLPKVQQYLPHLNAAMQIYAVNTLPRTAAFVAQTAHESAQYTRMLESLFYTKAAGLMATWPRRFPTEASALPYVRNEEKLANFVYANRMGNGDGASGDGFRYRGRGIIQLTGREKYRITGAALGVGLEASPELAQSPEVAFKAAGLFWKSSGLNELADAGDFRTITQRINGGQNGAADRLKYFEIAKRVLAAGFVGDPPLTRGARQPAAPTLLARDLGPWGREREVDAQTAEVKTVLAKKVTAPQLLRKKLAAKKPVAKRGATKTGAAKKAAGKEVAGKKGVEGKVERKTVAPKKAATKQVGAKKVVAKKVLAKKAAALPAKKVVVKKPAAKARTRR